MSSKNLNRRRFLKAGALGLAGAPLLSGCSSTGKDRKKTPGPVPEVAEARIRKYSTLGRTGLKVSDIGLGGAREKNVLRYALDHGVNLYDTAEQYFSGQHEADIGRAFKDVRDKVIVITKHVHGLSTKITKQNVIDRFDGSLKRMGFDYIDIAMIHHLANLEDLKNEELLGGYETLKKQGKFRFLGFSTHDAEKVGPAAFESGLLDVMLLIYNSVQYPNRSDTIRLAKKHGVGVLAMKTMAGRQQDRIKELVNERTTFSQAAIKWALTDECVNSVVISMRTFEHVDEYLPASGKQLTAQDEAVLKKYASAVDNLYCRIGCQKCLASCPERVAIPDIMRFGMYYENYGEEKKAVLEYSQLEGRYRAAPCRRCAGVCENACPHHLAVRDRLVHYDGLLRC